MRLSNNNQKLTTASIII